MNWTSSLLLLLLSQACCFPPGSGLINLDPDKARHINVISGPGKSTSIASSRPTITRPVRFVIDRQGFAKRQQLGLNQLKYVANEPINPPREDGRSASTRLNSSPDSVLTKAHNKPNMDIGSASPGLNDSPDNVLTAAPNKPNMDLGSASTRLNDSPDNVLTAAPNKPNMDLGSTSPGLNDSPDNVLTAAPNKPNMEAPTSSESQYPATGYTPTGDRRSGAFSEENSQTFNTKFEDASLDVCGLMADLPISHEDTFPCKPCECRCVTNNFVVANCTGRKLLRIPKQLPSKTLVLNLSFNRLKYLYTLNFIHYSYLLNVTISSNFRLEEIRNASLGNLRSNVKVLNLTSCSIKTIQDGSFNITPELTHLIIRHNKLTNLTTSTFKGLGQLLHLDLSANEIAFIEVGTFDDLSELVLLDLSRNKLVYSEKRISPYLFTGLKKLQKLLIHGNSPGTDKRYPDKALKILVELRELSIDGLANPTEFGPEMKALEKLTSLEIYGYCRIVNITKTFFQNIPHLTSFNMNSCPNFAHVHPNAYTSLERLETLSISTMRNYKLDSAFHDLAGLNTSSLRSISFRKLRRPDFQCRYLGHELSQYLQNFTLVHLDLSGNSISLMGNNFLKELPKTIKTLILSKNKFTAGTQSLEHLSVLTGITELDLSMQNMDNYYNEGPSSLNVAQDFSYSDRHLLSQDVERSDSPEKVRHVELTLNDSDTPGEQSDFTSTDKDQPSTISTTRRRMKIPPNLRTLKASQYTVFGMQILTHNLAKNNSLSVVDFSNSFMSIWGRGRLPRRITFANFGYNYCTTINSNFFQTSNSHLHLLLNNNFLGSDFAKDTMGEIFSKLSKTEYLDISANLIYTIPKQFFSGLSSLRYLHMSDNKLSILNASFAHMKTLQFIDLSKNSIIWIDAGTRDDLDAIAASPGHVLKVDLTMNPLPCTCDGLELISWMATTKVHFHKEHQLTCYPDNKVSEPLGDLENRRQRLQRSCMSKSLFIIGCSAALTVVMVIVMLGLMYRYRWKLRYLHNTAMAAIFGFKPEVSPKSGCTFDAYFVYTTDTRDFVLDQCLKELEQRRVHRLCVEDRDFWPGTYVVSSIVSAVRNSTKTVVVLTPDLLEEPYWEYSFKMAVMEELYKQRTVLHLLLYQPVASDQMSHDQLSLMRRNSYIEYPPDGEADEGVRGKFWDELSRVIGHCRNDNNDPVLDME